MRIVRQEFDPSMPVKDLHEYPDNSRRGDAKAVEESITTNGFFGAILVQRSSKRILAGHTRLKVARDDGAETIPGFWLDVTDEEAKKILLSDNRTSDLASNDDDALSRLLTATLADTGTLLGTGYDDDTYKLLLHADDPILIDHDNQTIDPTNPPRDTPRGVRAIILEYPDEVYDEVVEALAVLRLTYDLQTNAEVVLHLLREVRET